ncbi:MAG: hypothetical protein EXR48_04990 [Dehalococcoidia bacterium]|nr:hypothetical protein [Dehalococcoidia bacterium]
MVKRIEFPMFLRSVYVPLMLACITTVLFIACTQAQRAQKLVCDTQPVPTDLRFTTFQSDPLDVRFKFPRSWRLLRATSVSFKGEFFGRPELCIERFQSAADGVGVPGAWLSISETVIELQARGTYTNDATHVVEQVAKSNIALEHRPAKLDGQSAVWLVTKPLIAGDSASPARTVFSVFADHKGSLFYIMLTTPDPIRENSRAIFEEMVRSLEFLD